ncbi:MAG: hypothetical protein AAGF04_03895 [Chlamydiota bacterium]
MDNEPVYSSLDVWRSLFCALCLDAHTIFPSDCLPKSHRRILNAYESAMIGDKRALEMAVL